MKSILLLALFTLSCVPTAEKKLAVAQSAKKTEKATHPTRIGTPDIAVKKQKKTNQNLLPESLRGSEGFYLGSGKVVEDETRYRLIVFDISKLDVEKKEITFSTYVNGEKTSLKLPFTHDENGAEIKSGSVHFQLVKDGDQHIVRAERIDSISQGGPNEFYPTHAFSYDPKNKISISEPVINLTNLEWVNEQIVNASSTLLTAKDVENATAMDLMVMRLGVYARHGAAFKDLKMNDFFSYNNWYMPISTESAVEKTFSETEKKNIKLIKRYEEHAEHFYEEFGR